MRRRVFMQRTIGGAVSGSISGSIAGSALAALAATANAAEPTDPGDPLFRISLAQWSLHKALYAGEFTHLEFITRTRDAFGIDAVEYVNQFFKDRAEDRGYLREMNRRASDAGVRQLLIMVDGEGDLGDPDDGARAAAVINHIKWLDAARELGCHAIRVNAASKGEREEQAKLAADGLRRLAELGAERELDVIVENHGGYSSDGAWLADVMRRVDHPRLGTLPDFGNFCLDWSRSDEPEAWYDRYLGVRELMPFARAVSAKSYDFDEQGAETTIDFARMMRIVLNAGYRGYVGIEYEGSRLPEHEGVLATKRLLERVRAQLAPEFDSAD